MSGRDAHWLDAPYRISSPPRTPRAEAVGPEPERECQFSCGICAFRRQRRRDSWSEHRRPEPTLILGICR